MKLRYVYLVLDSVEHEGSYVLSVHLDQDSAVKAAEGANVFDSILVRKWDLDTQTYTTVHSRRTRE